MLEHMIKALMNGIENRCKDKFIVLFSISEHINGHICVASKHSDVIFNIHDIIFIHVQLCRCSTILFVWFLEQLFLKCFLLGVGLDTNILFLVVILGNNTSPLIIKDNHAFYIANHIVDKHSIQPKSFKLICSYKIL